MTNPILDRVAKAIEDAPVYYPRCRSLRWEVARMPDGEVVATAKSEDWTRREATRLTSQSRARAAIEAMMEPSEEMMDAGATAFLEHIDERPPLRPMGRAFRAMLSVVLK